MIDIHNRTNTASSIFQYSMDQIFFRATRLPSKLNICYSEKIIGQYDVVIIKSVKNNFIDKENIVFKLDNRSIIIYTDIVAIIYNSLTLTSEELIGPSSSDPKLKNQNIVNKTNNGPWIDLLVKKFFSIIENYYPSFQKTDIPPAMICLSHDIDKLYAKSMLRYTSILIRGLLSKSLNASLKSIDRLIRNPVDDRYNSIFNIVDYERQLGAKSTLYFMSLSHMISKEGFRYSIEDKRLLPIIDYLNKYEWDIGLHTSYYAHLKINKINSEKVRLERAFNREVNSVRNHYLRFKYPDTLSIYYDAGFTVDSTLGFTKFFGYRVPTAYPYHVFDNCNHNVLPIREIPMNIMDTPFVDWITLNKFSADKLIKNMMETVEIGVLTLNWHNHHIEHHSQSEHLKAYKLILMLLHDEDIMMVDADTIDNYYRNHESKIRNRLRYEIN
jgi:hypothetical protein